MLLLNGDQRVRSPNTITHCKRPPAITKMSDSAIELINGLPSDMYNTGPMLVHIVD